MLKQVIAVIAMMKSSGMIGQPGTFREAPSLILRTIKPRTVAAVLMPSVNPI